MSNWNRKSTWMWPTRDDLARAAITPFGDKWSGWQLQVLKNAGYLSSNDIVGELCRPGVKLPWELWDKFYEAGNGARIAEYQKANVRLKDGPVYYVQRRVHQTLKESEKLNFGIGKKRRIKKWRLAKIQRNNERIMKEYERPTKVTHQPAAGIQYHAKRNLVTPEERRKLFDDPIYKTVRAIVLRNHGHCRMCGRKPPEVVLHVDHIIPLTVDWERRMDPTNLQVLCADCNTGKSNLWT